jgi:parvulin-like peptidyl-prolyl isomerase
LIDPFRGFLFLLITTVALLARNPFIALGQTATEKDPGAVCARVDDELIKYADVARERDRQIKIKKIGDEELAIVDARIRDQLIDRALVIAALTRMGKAASRSDIDFELTRWKQELTTQGSSLADYLTSEKMTESDLRREILWRVSWSRYTTEFVTEANLEKFFKDHQAEYDGRKLRVAQILLKAPAKASTADRQALRDKASALRDDIIAKKQTFADAAKSHSESPSAKDGGELGWIERHEPMGEEFSKAAFALKAGETSPPVVTPFGVHLVHCVEIEPGKKTWRDVRRELERDASAYLAKWLADSQRDKSRIERTEVLPDLNASPKEAESK